MRHFFLYVLCLGAIYFCWNMFSAGRTHSIPPTTILSNLNNPPIQSSGKLPDRLKFKDGYVTFVASYDVTARVMSRENYSFDHGSVIAPIDLALGWERMSDPAIYERLHITQGNRFYHYSWHNGPPIPQDEIITSSANTHIIPANDNIKKEISKIKQGQVVSLKGYLVNYREDNGNRWWEWKTSTTRGDSGDGACELFYVEHVKIY